MTELTSLPAPAGSQLHALKVHAFDSIAPYADYAVPVADILAASAVGIYPEAMAQVPKGLALDTDTALTPGSGGTDGVFEATWSGGNFTVNPKARFKVRNGRIDWLKFDGPGLCVNASPSAPTVSLSASTGLTGASVPFRIEALVASGATYWADHASDATLWQLYRNNAGTAAALSGRTKPKNVNGVLDAALAAAASADQAADLVLPANIFVDVSLGTAEAAVSNGTNFKLVATSTGIVDVRKRGVSGSTLLYQELTRSALSGVNGAYLLGFGASTVGDVIAQFVHLKKHGLNKAGLLAALAEQQSTGGALVLPPQAVTIAGWDTPFDATAPLYIWGQNMDSSGLTFTSATASFIHQLDPILCFADFTLSGLTANTSANGGGAVYSLVADGATIGAAVAPKFHRMRFDGCKAPINIEVPFDGPEIRACENLNGTGHGFRFGNAGSVGSWGTWKRLSVIGWKVRSLATVGPGNNIYAGLAYGEGHYFDGFDLDGITGTMDRNGNAWATEAGGLHFQARNVRVGPNNVSRNITGAEVLRGIMVKGEANGNNSVVEHWIAECGGVGIGLAWYGKSGSARVTVIDPGTAAVEIGSALSMDSVHIHVDGSGTNRAGVYGVAGTVDSGHLKLTGTLDGFVKPVSVSLSAGNKSFTCEIKTTGGNGNGTECYLNSSVPAVTIEAESAVANSAYARWIRGASSAAELGRLTLRGPVTSVAGFGTVVDTITITELDAVQHSSGQTTPARVWSGTAIIKSGKLVTNVAGTTSGTTALTALSLPVPNGAALTLMFDVTARDGTDRAHIGRDHAFGAAAGAAIPDTTFSRLVSRPGGASTWDAAAINSGANAVLQFTGSSGKTPKFAGTATVIFNNG